MTVTKVYSIITDFGNDINHKKFRKNLRQSSFGDKLLSTQVDGDVITVRFTSLTAGEETELANIVSSHDSAPLTEPTYSNIINIQPNPRKTKSKRYYVVGSFIYPGEHQDTGHNSILKISCVTKMDKKDTDYSIRVYDNTNANIIAENTFTNTTEDIVELTPIANVPTTTAYIEIQIKRNGSLKNKKITINTIDFYLNVV